MLIEELIESGLGTARHWKPYRQMAFAIPTREISAIRVQAKADEQAKLADIDRLRAENADYYTLLTGTGRELCLAAIHSLRRLGFGQVIDVDTVSEPNELREDIQILDRSPALVIDVKGVTGHPEDAECQQAEKHVLMRCRGWKRTDVQALTIINSQRHLPPFERDQEPFRTEMVRNAEATSSGLMTTFDIALLLRNARKHGWPTSTVLPVFYRTGRILAIPAHYQHIGSIVKRWKHAIGIMPVSPIAVGDRIAFSRVGMDYIETVVTSLRVDDQSVNIASAGSNCGIAIPEDLLLREGLEVYVVKPRDEEATSQEVLATSRSKT